MRTLQLDVYLTSRLPSLLNPIGSIVSFTPLLFNNKLLGLCALFFQYNKAVTKRSKGLSLCLT